MTSGIILIGPPGAGKTSIGNALAKKLSLDFSDTDALIEKECKKTISEIFVEDGESFFRTTEERVCCTAIATINGVLSLGGGAILSALTQSALRTCALPVVFLDVSLTVAAPRVGFNRDRPLLMNNPRQQWQSLMEKRRPIYENLATLTILVDEKSVLSIVDEISHGVANS